MGINSMHPYVSKQEIRSRLILLFLWFTIDLVQAYHAENLSRAILKTIKHNTNVSFSGKLQVYEVAIHEKKYFK